MESDSLLWLVPRGQSVGQSLRRFGLSNKVIRWQRLTEISAQLDYVQRVDLSSEESSSAAAKETLKIAKKVDVLIYAAGKLKVSTSDNLEVADWDEMFNVNVRGLYLVCKHLVRAAGVRVVVPIGSVAAHVGAELVFFRYLIET
jgi:NADP-dependent 3-hydroxy acid dehydrogenase YdfG